MNCRVVVTGMAGLTSLGHNWDSIRAGVVAGRNGIQRLGDWAKIDGLNTNLGGPIDDFEVPEHYTRKQVRSMGRVSLFATSTAERALSLDPSLAWAQSVGEPLHVLLGQVGRELHRD